MFVPSHRLIALLLLGAVVWRAWPSARVVWAVLLCAAVALSLIYFAAEIDEFTFGTSASPVRRIDTHTAPWLIVLFGWMLLLGISALVFFAGVADPPRP
jgi:hypothetical protein